MKKRLQGLVAGVLIGTMLTSGMALAKQASETINVIYDNIKILIDGEEYQPKDANGNVVEPFIYNGTTYLPVRAIANAFDKEVGWSAETMTVSLGSQKFEWLNKQSHIDYQPEYCGSSEFTLIDNGIRLYQSGGGVWHEYEMFPKQTVTYKINGDYSKFVATLYNNESNGAGTKVTFYGDNKKILHSIPAMSSDTPKIDIEVDISNQKILYIEVQNIDFYEGEINFSNARLLK